MSSTEQNVGRVVGLKILPEQKIIVTLGLKHGVVMHRSFGGKNAVKSARP